MPNGMKTNWRIQGNAFVGMAAVQGDRGRAGIMTAGSKKDVGWAQAMIKDYITNGKLLKKNFMEKIVFILRASVVKTRGKESN